MGIRKRIVYGVAVAAATTWVPSMVAWIAPLRIMAEVSRRPAVCCMTDVALYSRA